MDRRSEGKREDDDRLPPFATLQFGAIRSNDANPEPGHAEPSASQEMAEPDSSKNVNSSDDEEFDEEEELELIGHRSETTNKDDVIESPESPLPLSNYSGSNHSDESPGSPSRKRSASPSEEPTASSPKRRCDEPLTSSAPSYQLTPFSQASPPQRDDQVQQDDLPAPMAANRGRKRPGSEVEKGPSKVMRTSPCAPSPATCSSQEMHQMASCSSDADSAPAEQPTTLDLQLSMLTTVALNGSADEQAAENVANLPAQQQPIIEDISDEDERPPLEALQSEPDVQLLPDALRQRYDLHLPLHQYTDRTRGQFVAELQQIGKLHSLRPKDLDALCQSMLQFVPESVRFCRSVRSALPLNLVSCPLKPQLEPRVFGWCDECYVRFPAYGIRTPPCPTCKMQERVHLVATRDVLEVLRLALRTDVIRQHDEIQLLMSVAKHGSTSSVILDVLSKTQSAVRIVAAIMHSPMVIRANPGRKVSPQIFLNTLLNELVTQMKDVEENNLHWTDVEGNVMPPVRVAVVAAVSADGINELQNTKPDSCPYCEVVGRSSGEGDVTYPYAEAKEATPRDHARTVEHSWDVYNLVVNRKVRPACNVHVAGVKGMCCASRLPRFDVVHSFSPDIGRLLLQVGIDLLLTPGMGGHRLSTISHNQQMAMDAQLAEALVPPFARAPNFREGVDSWSSGQMIDWIVHYSLACLADKWSLRRQQHWASLVKAVFLLNQETITEDDLQVAQSCIDAFMSEIGTFFPAEAETLPVHMLTHLVEATRFLGPLWKTSSNRFHASHQIIKMAASVQEPILHRPTEMRSLLSNAETNVAVQMELDADDARFAVAEGVGLPVSRSQLIYDAHESEDVTFYAKAAFNGSVYSSELRRGEGWTPYVRVKKGAGNVIAKVLHFAKCKRTKRLSVVCRKMRVDRDFKFTTACNRVLTHTLAAVRGDEFFACGIDLVQDRLIRVRNFLSHMPHPELRGFFHNDAP